MDKSFQAVVAYIGLALPGVALVTVTWFGVRRISKEHIRLPLQALLIGVALAPVKGELVFAPEVPVTQANRQLTDSLKYLNFGPHGGPWIEPGYALLSILATSLVALLALQLPYLFSGRPWKDK